MRSDDDLLTPEGFADHAPSRPLPTSAHARGDGFTLQRYRHPPSTIDVRVRDAVLVGHLVGPVLVDEDDPTGRRIHRWTGPGQISLTPAGESVRRIVRGRPDVVLLHLAPDLLREVADEIGGCDARSVRLVRRFGLADPTADQLIRLLWAEAEMPGPNASPMTGALIRALAIHLLRSHSNFAGPLAEPEISEPAPRIRRVIDRMRTGLDEELTLDRLAAVAGLSRSQLVRAFREATGLSPHRYLRGLRIDRARFLLERTTMPVIEVGLTCGFGQPSHFATAFRDATGLSPRAWRQIRHG